MGPVRQQIAFYASTPSYLPVLEAEGWDFGGELTRCRSGASGRRWPCGYLDDAVLTVGVAATADRLADAIRERYGDRVQRIGFYTIGSFILDAEPEALREVIGKLKAYEKTIAWWCRRGGPGRSCGPCRRF